MPWLRSATSWSLLQHAAAPVLALSLVAGAPVTGVTPSAGSPLVDRAAALERQAVELAHQLRAVPDDPSESLCPRDLLEVRWEAPQGFSHGAHVGEIGPRPGPTTEAVNGVVVCGASTWAYMGFEAAWDGRAWQVAGVPHLEDEHGDVSRLNLDAGPVTDDEHADTHVPTPVEDDAAVVPVAPASSTPSPSGAAVSVPTSAWLAGLGPVEPYAVYDPQTTCTPAARPGTVIVRDTLLGVHTGTRNLGIVRACHVGGRSEHKEGRAFDWGAYVTRPVERAAVERFVTQLLATDADGNGHALARRMGVMYLVWNGQIWSAYRASEGWRPYRGPNPHTDHIHISFSRAGADARTSFFTLDLASRGVLGQLPPGTTLPTATPAAASVTSTTTGGAPGSPSAPAATTDDAPAQDAGQRRLRPHSPAPDTRDDGQDSNERRPGPSEPASPAPSPGDDDRRREEEREQRRGGDTMAGTATEGPSTGSGGRGRGRGR